MTGVIAIRTSNSTRPVLNKLLDIMHAKTDLRAELIVDSSKNSLDRIEAGERSDIAILQDEAIDRLTGLGVFEAQMCTPFARSPIGLAVARGAPKPPIETVDQVRQVLLDARAIAHTEFGPSGRYFPKLMQRLGIAEQVRPKEVTRPGGYIAQLVVDGEADLAFQQMSELRYVPQVDIIGLIPDAIQSVILSKAAIFAECRQKDLARAVVAFFAAKENAAIFEAAGLEQAV